MARTATRYEHVSLDEAGKALLTDPQTSGGLLVACDPQVTTEVLSIFLQQGFDHAVVIGEVEPGIPLHAFLFGEDQARYVVTTGNSDPDAGL